jgi:hypothetical protein
MSSGEPALVSMLDDVPLIVAASGLSPEQIIFFGRSLGSLYALHGAALYPGAAGLIIESGPADPLERILVWITHGDGGAPLAELKSEVDCHLDQRAKIDAFGGRVLVMQSRHDDLVSVSHAERLYAWAKEPKELLIFERGDHNSILSANQKAYLRRWGILSKRRDNSRDIHT